MAPIDEVNWRIWRFSNVRLSSDFCSNDSTAPLLRNQDLAASWVDVEWNEWFGTMKRISPSGGFSYPWMTFICGQVKLDSRQQQQWTIKQINVKILIQCLGFHLLVPQPFSTIFFSPLLPDQLIIPHQIHFCLVVCCSRLGSNVFLALGN